MTIPKQIILLCEDDDHVEFVRGVMRAVTEEAHDLSRLLHRVPAGSWTQVVSKFHTLLSAFRRPGPLRWLVVVIDADSFTVDQRIERLMAPLAGHQVDPPTENELVVIAVPKWAIETWILHLMGLENLAETMQITKDHKDRARPHAYDAGVRLLAHRDKPLSQTAPPSLSHGWQQINERLFATLP